MDGEPSIWPVKFQQTPCDVEAMYSGRRGGVSPSPFDSLNLAFGNGDDPQRVATNRRMFAQVGGFDLRRVVQPVCEDGDQVFRVHVEDVGRGAWAADPTLVAEGLVTAVPNVMLMVAVADSVPVYLAAAGGTAVGLVRVGWRGLVNGVLRNMVTMFGEQFGVPAAELCVALGPSIGPCCFDVGPDVARRFRDVFPQSVREVGRNEKARIDLPRAVASAMVELGVPSVVDEVPCTRCHDEDFFSLRAAEQGVTGRQLACIRRVAAIPPARKRYPLPLL